MRLNFKTVMAAGFVLVGAATIQPAPAEAQWRGGRHFPEGDTYAPHAFRGGAYGPRYYGKAMNISRRLTAAYDRALQRFDLLLMPTTPMKATPLPGPEASREEYIQRALEMIANTAPFDISHHPAMSIPCGMIYGLPVGLMLVGKHFDEPTIYRAAYAFEQSGDWRKL